MMTTTRCRLHRDVAVLAGLAGLTLALIGCATAPDEAAAGATGALEAAPVDEAAIAEAPVVVDLARVARADEALLTILSAIDDPEARFAARLEQFRIAQDDVLHDGELDRRSMVETAAAIRTRLLGTEEAARDGEAAFRARSERDATIVTTPMDSASIERARALVERRAGTRPAVPMELRTPEGVSTATPPLTAEELHYDAR